MQKPTPRSRSGMLWLFLLLVPLSLVGLDAYGVLFPKMQASDFPLQGLIPLSVPAQTAQPLSLSLLQAVGADYQISLTGPETELLIPGKLTEQDPLQPQRWQSYLPALAAGTYQLRLQPTRTQSGLPVREFTLQVQPQPLWQAQLSFSKLPMASQIPLTVTAAEAGQVQARLLGAQADLPSWSFSHQPPLSAPALSLPKDLQAGDYHIELRFQAKNPPQNQAEKASLQKLDFQILPTSAAADFQVSAASQVLLKKQAQKLHLWVMNSNQQPLESGWVRILAKNWPVKAGQAEVDLQAHQIASRLAYTLGDAQGNLFQGELALALDAGDWLVKLNQKRQPYILARKPLHVHYFMQLKQSPVLATGVLDLQAGENDLTALSKEPIEALYLVDANGRQQSLAWPQPDRFALPTSSSLTVQPLQANALQDLQISFHTAEPGVAAGGSSATLVQAYKKAGLIPNLLQAPPANYYLLGFPVSQSAPVWATLVWLLLAFALIAWPWLYLQRELLSWVAQHRRPFPSPEHMAALAMGHWAALSMSLAGCGLVLLSWLLPVPIWGAGAVLVLAVALAVCSFACWRLRQTLPPTSYLLPLIQFLYFCWCLWFVLAYAPVMISGLSLVIALAGFAWLTSFVFLRGKELSQTRGPLLALATLTVIALLQAGVSWVRPPTGLFAQSEPGDSLPPLRDWQPQALLIYQSRQSAAQQVKVPALQESGEIALLAQHYSWLAHSLKPLVAQPEYALTRLRPAVLARLSVPLVAVLGDQLKLSLTVVNPLTQSQSVALRVTPGTPATLELAARTQQSIVSPFSVVRLGWNPLTLAHRFEQNWYTQQSRVFGIGIEPAQENRDLRLEVRVPQAENLVPGEEIPVLVHFQHRLRGDQKLGLQIGLPAGFTVLTDTLQDSTNGKWLAGFEQNSAYLNLRTQALPPGQELSFHFRLRANLQGQMKMPPSRLLVLEQPTLKTVLSPIQLSVSAPN